MRVFNSLLSVTLLLVLLSCIMLSTQVNTLSNLHSGHVARLREERKLERANQMTHHPMDDNQYIGGLPLPTSLEEIRQFYDERPTGFSTDELLDIGAKMFLLMKDTLFLWIDYVRVD